MLTVCIPCAPYHSPLLPRALDSVYAQTVQTAVLYEMDTEGVGPGVLRNRMLAQVQTPYVAFLDADDWLEPAFAEMGMNAISANHYAYSDWYEGQKVIHASDKPWCGGTWHIITAVLHTQHARAIGGFDETLSALEDTEFWLKLVTRRICGVHIRQPLVHYSGDGQRSKEARASGRESQIREQLLKQFGGMMGCCGEQAEAMQALPLGMQQEGDVLAVALWRGNHPEYGRATGRRYPRMSYPKMTWVDPRDVQARPDMWQVVQQAPAIQNAHLNGLDGFAEALQQTGILGNKANTAAPAEFGGILSPDVDYVVRVAKERLGK